MTRVCVLCESWGSGGIEAFLCNAVSHMDCTDMEIDLVCARLEESIFTQTMKRCGVQCYELSGSTGRIAENHRQFKKLLKERRYDMVHLNAYQGLSLAYLRIAREAGVPVRVAHSHNTQLRRSRTRALKLAIHWWARAWYSKEATALWACSRPAAKFLFGSGKKYTFIPNGIDIERFRFNPEIRMETRKELGAEDAFIMGNVGRFCYQKNQNFLLEVFACVQKLRPKSRLLLIGEGEGRQALEAKAKRLGVAASTIFYGVTGETERLYWAMDAYVMPSHFEGLPVSAVEAQATGLPCVFSDAITRECAITGQAAFLPLEAGGEKWADAVLTQQGQNVRWMAANFVESQGFSISSVAKRMQNFCIEAVEISQKKETECRQ